MSLLQINTAIPLAEPLLEQQQQQQQEQANDDENAEDKSIEERLVVGEFQSRIKSFSLGTMTGFFIQVVSLGAYAFILVHFNGMSPRESGVLSMDGFFRATTTTTSEGDLLGREAVLYTVLSVLTQLDLVVYVMIWVGFTCTLSRNGMNCIQSQFPLSSSNQAATPDIRQRYVFVLGVCFLVGIVVGAFAAWTSIDVYLDFPVPLQPILLTVLVDLALCYMMVKCFDMGNSTNSKATTKELVQYAEDEETLKVGEPICC